ncbi:MAG: hypothetical protein K0V04_20065 [Deltaproteobacteria bacterium]|nr:hypothetical protein [Deltaproteobacteria bacterium]
MSVQVELFTKAKTPRLPQKTLRGRVLDALRAQPSTDEELCRVLRRPSNSVRPRRVELEREGTIRCVGERKSSRGRPSKVWALVEGGAQ